MHVFLLLVTLVAQTPAPPPPPAGRQDGFVVQSADGGNRVVFGLTAQTDGRFSLDDPKPTINTFTIRKARPTLSGRVAKYFEFRVMPDFGGGTAVLQDAYVDVRVSPTFRVRGGKDKVPIGYELLQGDPYLLFPERALASSLVPVRDVGFEAIGELSSQLSFAGGVFNGVPDGTSGTNDVDANNSKDFAGRLTWHVPSGLGFQIGGSAGSQTGALPSFRTSVGQTYFSYAPGHAAAGDRRRVSPAVFYYRKAFGAFGEYMRTSQEVSRPSGTDSVVNDGWEVTTSYVLTGEPASDRGLRPAHPFDPPNGQWGALQIVARYSALRIDPIAFSHALAAPGASARAAAFAAGANWYPATAVKYYVMYERTSFDGGHASRPTEDVIVFRMQVAF
jgi:phosphate-selective porin OprO/OprP